MTDDDKPFTVESAAEWLDCSPMHVRNLIRRGQLAYYRLGGGRLIRIPRSALLELQKGARKQRSPANEKIVERKERADWRTPRPVE